MELLFGDSLLIVAMALLAMSSAVSVSTIAVVLKLPLNRFFQDPPGKRKIHQRTIPRLGGLCLVVSFLAISYIVKLIVPGYFPSTSQTLLDALVLVAAAILVIGCLDDTYIIEIDNKAKLLLEILLAAELVAFMGISFSRVQIFGSVVDLGWFGGPLTVVWLVGVTNAINIIDGIDGLAGSLVLAGTIAMGLLGHAAGAIDIVLLCAILAGITAGFLLHNAPPARVFLGDTGSLFLGMILGVLSVRIASASASEVPYPLLSSFLVAGLPVLDVFVAMARRFFKTLLAGMGVVKSLGSMIVPDSGHIHHRLTHRGLTHWETTFFLTLFGSLFCISAIVISRAPHVVSAAVLVYLCAISLWLLGRLSFLERIPEIFEFPAPRAHVQRRRAIGVVQAEEILTHALANFDQEEFDFRFLNRQQITASVFDHSAIIVVNVVSARYLDDHDFASRMAQLHKCPAILIADSHEMAPLMKKSEDMVHLTKRPVYIPALLNVLDRTIRQRSAESNKSYRRLNGALQPVVNWTHNAAKLPKR